MALKMGICRICVRFIFRLRRCGSCLFFWGRRGAALVARIALAKVETHHEQVGSSARKLNLWPLPLLNSVLSALLLCPARSDVPGHQSSLPLPSSRSNIN